mmetsp:Transcript_25048/g.73315  ORF Transcript_25048/g.73315 Transcript_25048/m.73315 type:complete len:240 (+) Transcript_25048:2368-3087(+)
MNVLNAKVFHSNKKLLTMPPFSCSSAEWCADTPTPPPPSAGPPQTSHQPRAAPPPGHPAAPTPVQHPHNAGDPAQGPFPPSGVTSTPGPHPLQAPSIIPGGPTQAHSPIPRGLVPTSTLPEETQPTVACGAPTLAPPRSHVQGLAGALHPGRLAYPPAPSPDLAPPYAAPPARLLGGTRPSVFLRLGSPPGIRQAHGRPCVRIGHPIGPGSAPLGCAVPPRGSHLPPTGHTMARERPQA